MHIGAADLLTMERSDDPLGRRLDLTRLSRLRPWKEGNEKFPTLVECFRVLKSQFKIFFYFHSSRAQICPAMMMWSERNFYKSKTWRISSLLGVGADNATRRNSSSAMEKSRKNRIGVKKMKNFYECKRKERSRYNFDKKSDFLHNLCSNSFIIWNLNFTAIKKLPRTFETFAEVSRKNSRVFLITSSGRNKQRAARTHDIILRYS